MTDSTNTKPKRNRKRHPRHIYKADVPPHIFLREMLRHYIEFREYVAQGNDHIIEHSYLVRTVDGRIKKVTMSFSYWDLHRGIKELPPRKKEALYYNIILDKKQKEVAELMGISPVSAGQYCDLGLKAIVNQFYDGGKAIMTEVYLDNYDQDEEEIG